MTSGGKTSTAAADWSGVLSNLSAMTVDQIIARRPTAVFGAPRSMKMGTIASPWRYDDDAENATGTTVMHGGCRLHCADCGLEVLSAMA